MPQATTNYQRNSLHSLTRSEPDKAMSTEGDRPDRSPSDVEVAGS